MVKFDQGPSGGTSAEDLKPRDRASMKALRHLHGDKRVAPPAVDFVADDTTVETDVTVTFTATIQGQWSTGNYRAELTNGQVSVPVTGTVDITPASPIASFDFNQAGTYDITLTVEGPGGPTVAKKIGYMVIEEPS